MFGKGHGGHMKMQDVSRPKGEGGLFGVQGGLTHVDITETWWEKGGGRLWDMIVPG